MHANTPPYGTHLSTAPALIQGTDCCGIFVTKNVLLIATITNGIIMVASFITLCVGLSIYCNYYDDCRTQAAMIITGSILTSICAIFFVVILVLLFKMGSAVPTRCFMPQQPYPTYGNPAVSTTTVQTSSQSAPYAPPTTGYPQYQQHPQPVVPQAPAPQAPMPQAPMPQVSMAQTYMSQASMPFKQSY